MSLQSILDYRRHVEDLIRTELATLTRDLETQVEALRHLEGEVGRLLGDIARREREGVVAAEALALYRFAETLSSDITVRRREAAALSALLEDKRTGLMAAARDRRVVELLEARREQEGVREETRREQRTTDEAAGRRGREMSDRAVTNE